MKVSFYFVLSTASKEAARFQVHPCCLLTTIYPCSPNWLPAPASTLTLDVEVEAGSLLLC
jgi:hypothetical protein